MAPADIKAELTQLFSKGGPDGRYTPQMTAEGTLLFADLRPYNISGGVDFLGQVHHATKVHHYNDTINMLISSPSTTNTELTVFSISQIAGALGDASQNYANIMNFVSLLKEPSAATTLLGCPMPRTVVPEVGAPESLHASCRANFTFSSNSCSDVSSALVSAAKAMSGFDSCGSSEKCGYSITEANAVVVKGHHETPVKHYKDDLSFALTPTGATSCEVGGYSTSEIWYAVLDDGTNYCNLHNLVSATNLAFDENVDKSDCTQYSSANCNKY